MTKGIHKGIAHFVAPYYVKLLCVSELNMLVLLHNDICHVILTVFHSIHEVEATAFLIDVSM